VPPSLFSLTLYLKGKITCLRRVGGYRGAPTPLNTTISEITGGPDSQPPLGRKMVTSRKAARVFEGKGGHSGMDTVGAGEEPNGGSKKGHVWGRIGVQKKQGSGWEIKNGKKRDQNGVSERGTYTGKNEGEMPGESEKRSPIKRGGKRSTQHQREVRKKEKNDACKRGK